MIGYRFLLPAEEEMTQASVFYEAAASGLGTGLLDEVQRVIDILREHPELGYPVGRGLRRALLHRFPVGYGYWHWMEDVWLVAGVAAGVTAQNLAEWLEQTPSFASLNYLVLEVAPGKSYWGRNIQPAWDWMTQEWKPFFDTLRP